MILNSSAFNKLVEEGKQMAKYCIKLKEKNAMNKMRLKEMSIKYENDLKEAINQETKKIQQIIDEVNIVLMHPEKIPEPNDQQFYKTEAEKYYKINTDLHKSQISSLEVNLQQAEKQIAALQKDRKKLLEPIDPAKLSSENSADQLKKLLQQKITEFQSEHEMAEMWMSELDITTKAYEQEKKKNKTLSEEVFYIGNIKENRLKN